MIYEDKAQHENMRLVSPELTAYFDALTEIAK